MNQQRRRSHKSIRFEASCKRLCRRFVGLLFVFGAMLCLSPILGCCFFVVLELLSAPHEWVLGVAVGAGSLTALLPPLYACKNVQFSAQILDGQLIVKRLWRRLAIPLDNILLIERKTGPMGSDTEIFLVVYCSSGERFPVELNSERESRLLDRLLLRWCPNASPMFDDGFRIQERTDSKHLVLTKALQLRLLRARTLFWLLVSSVLLTFAVIGVSLCLKNKTEDLSQTVDGILVFGGYGCAIFWAIVLDYAKTYLKTRREHQQMVASGKRDAIL